MTNMLEYLGVTSNFPSIANQAATLRWAFHHSNGTPVNLDGTAITGYILAAGINYPIAIAPSPLPNEAHILHASIPPLPEGRWQYETHAQSQDGESQRLISGYISVLKNLQPQENEKPTQAERTLLISLPSNAAETLHLRWLANTAAQAAASSANSSAQHATAKAEAANNSANAASASASHAASSATSATSSANNASNSASQATTSATSAKTSETNASASSTTAQAAATAAKTSETNANNSANTASEKANTASHAATAAKTSETNATQSANHANTSATNAANSATQAATSANSIGEAETNSSASATAAAKSATEAKTSAQNSEASANTANTKATQATNAATDAANSATSAKTSQTTAQTSANTATAKAEAAAASAFGANIDKVQAGIKATNAAASATQAASSATSIGNAESNTAASATAAKTSETNAAASSTQASTSAINAKTSETNAATSATNASNSASSATAKATEAAASASTAQTAINSIGNSLSQAAASATNAAASANSADSSAKSAAASQTAANNSATNAATSANQAAASALGASNTLNTLNSQKGQAQGIATLDATARVPASQLPSYVDDVLEYTTRANFPSTGEPGKLYVTTDNNKLYRWTGSTYIEITSAPIIVTDNLNSTSPTDALSANQGRLLNSNKLDNSHNTAQAAHQDIREQLTGIARLGNLNQWTGDNLFPANSVTIGGKYPVLEGDIIVTDNLNSTSPTDALSANQGRLLNTNKLDNSHNTSSDAHQEIRNQISDLTNSSVPAGGYAGQTLVKNSDEDYSMSWSNIDTAWNGGDVTNNTTFRGDAYFYSYASFYQAGVSEHIGFSAPSGNYVKLRAGDGEKLLWDGSPVAMLSDVSGGAWNGGVVNDESTFNSPVRFNARVEIGGFSCLEVRCMATFYSYLRANELFLGQAINSNAKLSWDNSTKKLMLTYGTTSVPLN